MPVGSFLMSARNTYTVEYLERRPWMGFVLDVVRWVLATIKEGRGEEVGGIPSRNPHCTIHRRLLSYNSPPYKDCFYFVIYDERGEGGRER